VTLFLDVVTGIAIPLVLLILSLSRADLSRAEVQATALFTAGQFFFLMARAPVALGVALRLIVAPLATWGALILLGLPEGVSDPLLVGAGLPAGILLPILGISRRSAPGVA